MTSYEPAKKNTAFIMYLGLPSQANVAVFQANPTLATGDVKVSIDGGALANVATLPTVTPASGKMVKLSLSSSEMNGDNITVVFSDAAGAEWYDTIVGIPTAVRQVDDLAFPATSGRSMVVDAAGLVDANAVKLGPTGAGTAQTAGDVGAEAAAIKVQTDKLAFTVANQIDANVIDWKGAAAPAMTGDAFARLGAAGAGLTALGDARIANLDATVSSRLASGGYTAPDNASIAAIKASTDNLPSDPADESLIIAATNALASSIAALPTADANATALLDQAAGVETGTTLRQWLRLAGAVLLGKLSGGGTTTEVFRDIGDTKARVTATVDASGNRTGITKDST